MQQFCLNHFTNNFSRIMLLLTFYKFHDLLNRKIEKDNTSFFCARSNSIFTVIVGLIIYDELILISKLGRIIRFAVKI